MDPRTDPQTSLRASGQGETRGRWDRTSHLAHMQRRPADFQSMPSKQTRRNAAAVRQNHQRFWTRRTGRRAFSFWLSCQDKPLERRTQIQQPRTLQPRARASQLENETKSPASIAGAKNSEKANTPCKQQGQTRFSRDSLTFHRTKGSSQGRGGSQGFPAAWFLTQWALFKC